MCTTRTDRVSHQVKACNGFRSNRERLRQVENVIEQYFLCALRARKRELFVVTRTQLWCPTNCIENRRIKSHHDYLQNGTIKHLRTMSSIKSNLLSHLNDQFALEHRENCHLHNNQNRVPNEAKRKTSIGIK